MRTNEAKARMKQGKAALGVGLGLGSTLAAEVLSMAGFDFALVDYQHGNWDDASALAAFRSICMGKAVPMVRVQKNDYYTIGRALDRGAMGIVVPMVNSVEEAKEAAHSRDGSQGQPRGGSRVISALRRLEEAKEAARAVRYPPIGGRSMGPFGTRFLGDDYAQKINDEVFLAIQIESKVAAEHAEEILAVEGVDGCWVGPGDLSLSMGVNLNTPEGRQAHEAAILGVLAACHKTGKIPGIAGTPATAAYWLDKGFLFVTVASDVTFLINGSAELLKTLRPRVG